MSKIDLSLIQGSSDFGVYRYATGKPANSFFPQFWVCKNIFGKLTSFKGVVRGVGIAVIPEQLKAYGSIKKTCIQKREAIMISQRLSDGALA